MLQKTDGDVVMARKGIPYSRFSGKRQEAGDSQRRQDDLAAEAARAEGVELDLTLSLSDKGISAFRGANWKRGDLGKFLDLVDGGVIARGSVLIVEQVNRLSRMPWMQQVELWKEILSRDIVIRTCVPPSRYTKDNLNELATGCPLVIYMMLAHQDSQQKSDWLREAWGQKKKHASSEKHTPHGRGCPEWLLPICEPHPKDPERIVTLGYDMIEERRALIEKMFRLVLEKKWGPGRITRWLNANHLPAWNRGSKVGQRRTGIEAKWRQSWVRYILENRRVIGEYQPLARTEKGQVPEGPPVPGYYPAAIGEDLFLDVQRARKARRRTGGRPGVCGVESNLFTGLVFEGFSRRSFTMHYSGAKGKIWHMLATDPATVRIPYPAFEQTVLDAVAALRPADVDGRHQADALTSEVERLQEERTRLDVALEELDQQTRELPVERWPRRVVARMAELESLIEGKDVELQVAKEKANTSGRTEALTELRTCVDLLDEVRGTEREAGVRERIKVRLPRLIESIWAVVQSINKQCRIIHIRVYLQGGEQRYYARYCGPNPLCGWPAPWPLQKADLRGGDVGGQAVRALAGLDAIAGQPAR
jgi:DNA invertase Pin-like site-specific DNA recombinase